MVELADVIFNWLLVPSNIIISSIAVASFLPLVCLVTDFIYDSSDADE